MNDTQLENAIRAELAADAARTPAAEPTKLAVRAAVTGLPSTDHAQLARRWLLPIAAAAVLVALLVAGFLVPKALSSHPARPATPQPTPSPTEPALPPAPVVALSCPSGQRTVDGLSTKFTDGNGAPRYAYEYFCAGADGRRGRSEVRIYQQLQGNLLPDAHEVIPLTDVYLMGLTPLDGGLKLREYSLSPGLDNGPYGEVLDVTNPVDDVGGAQDVAAVAEPCTAPDLTVTTSSASEPVPHSVLTLSNKSSRACSVWGTPKYSVIGSVPATIRYVVSGPAGGAEGLPSSPVLLVQPGHSVSASVGADAISGSGCQDVDAVKAVLANGVSLGTPDLHVCDNMVGYPFVDSPNGSLTHPESEAPHNTATGTCVDNVGTVIELGSPSVAVNHRRHDVITIHPADKADCTLSGYADVRQLSASGVLQAIAQQTASGPAGGISGSTPPTVDVSPGHPASVLIEWSDQGQRCTPSGQISMRLGGGIYSDGGSTGPVCDLQVHPFVAGATGSETGAKPVSCRQQDGYLVSNKRVAQGAHAGVIALWKNNGIVPCAIDGYPTALWTGPKISNFVDLPHTPRGYLGGLAVDSDTPPQLLLLPGESMSSLIEWTTTGSDCVQATILSLSLPNTGEGLTNFGTTQCNAQVHPYVFGTTGKG